jgi:uncharacterized membrane protein
VSNIIVITFDNEGEAKEVREALKEIQHGGYISLDDSAIVVRDQEGKYHVHNELDRGVKVGALGGGFLGLLLGVMFAPIGGLLIGAAAGGLIGSAFDVGISKKFIKDVEASMEPGTSALFVIVREANPTMALAALKPFKGEVYHTSLDPDDEEHLRKILSKKT